MKYSDLVVFLLGFTTSFIFNHVEAHLDAEGIIGGTDAKSGQFKYQVSLETEYDNICGGGIIDDRHVLTAAHCVTYHDGSFKENLLTVLAGVNKAKADESKEPAAVRFEVEKIYIPREYQPLGSRAGAPYRTVGDIAVLKLSGSLGLDSNPLLRKLELPRKGENKEYPTFDDENAVIAGFGYNWINVAEDQWTHRQVEFDGGSTDMMRFAEAKVFSNDVCKRFVVEPVYESHVCAAVKQRNRREPEGICSGDSGSPLVYNGTTIIGVASSSPTGCKEDESPAVYTRVSYYIPFIQNALKDLKTPKILSATLQKGFFLSKWFTDKKYSED